MPPISSPASHPNDDDAIVDCVLTWMARAAGRVERNSVLLGAQQDIHSSQRLHRLPGARLQGKPAENTPCRRYVVCKGRMRVFYFAPRLKIGTPFEMAAGCFSTRCRPRFMYTTVRFLDQRTARLRQLQISNIVLSDVLTIAALSYGRVKRACGQVCCGGRNE